MRTYAPGEHIYVWADTADIDGAPIAPSSAFDASDIRIYKNGSPTQRASTSGITPSSPFDSVTGFHLWDIDSSDNDDPGFFASGEFTVVLHTSKTIDDAPIRRKVLKEFAIGTVPANVTAIANNVITTASINDGALTNAKFADSFLTAAKIATDAFASAKFADNFLTAAKIANGAIDAATFAADVAALILGYIVDDATKIDASALNTATGTTIPAILDDTDLIDDGTSGLAKIATDVAAILVDTGTTLDAFIQAIKAKTDNLPSDPADASVIAAAHAAIEAKVDTVDLVVDAIKLKTDNLPSDPADQSIIIDATNAILTAVGDVPTVAEFEARTLAASAYFDPSTDKVQLHATQPDYAPATSAALATAQLDLDTLTGADGVTLATSQPNYAPATASALTTLSNTVGVAGAGLTEAGGTGDHLTAISYTGPAATAIADATLIRAVSNVENTADKHSLAATVMLSTNASISGTTVTAKKPSDDSTFQTYTVTVDASADPITGVS